MATGRDEDLEVEDIYPGDEPDRATEKDLMRLVAFLQSEELASGARAATTAKAPAGGSVGGAAKELGIGFLLARERLLKEGLQSHPQGQGRAGLPVPQGLGELQEGQQLRLQALGIVD